MFKQNLELALLNPDALSVGMLTICEQSIGVLLVLDVRRNRGFDAVELLCDFF